MAPAENPAGGEDAAPLWVSHIFAKQQEKKDKNEAPEFSQGKQENGCGATRAQERRS